MPAWSPFLLLLICLVLLGIHLASPKAQTWVWKVLAVQGVLMLISGAYLGLVWAPPEREMGDVYRIIYMHVPAVWITLIAFTLNFASSIAYLFKHNWVSDNLSEATAEVGIVFGAVGVTLGAIWGRPTWGVWWDWDPRITTAAIMLVIYSGYLVLRNYIEDPDKRATWSAVVAIIAYVDIPILWFSVKWWRSLHQPQSTPKTVDPDMALVLRWSAIAFLCLFIVYVWQRYLQAKEERAFEISPPEDNAKTYSANALESP